MSRLIASYRDICIFDVLIYTCHATDNRPAIGFVCGARTVCWANSILKELPRVVSVPPETGR
jgi:hypothetical protein